MAKVGKKPWIPSEKEIEKVEALAARGMEQQDIALCLGIDAGTLTKKNKVYGRLDQAIKRGKARGIARVTNALIKNIDIGNVTAQIFYLKTQARWRDQGDTNINFKINEQTVKRIKDAENKYK